MKTLQQYIVEASLEKNDLLHPKGGVENFKEAMKIVDDIYNFLKFLGGSSSPGLTKETYSLSNKQDMNLVYNAFKKIKRHPNTGEITSKMLYKWNIENLEKFIGFLNDNAATLLDKNGKYRWELPKILQYNPSKLEKEYEKWKESEDFVQGHKWDESEYDPNTEERTIIIYDRKDNANPATTIEYPFKGKRGKATDHQVNMLRVQWCKDCDYKTADKYYDAYPKLANNFYKYGPAPYDEVFDNSDLD